MNIPIKQILLETKRYGIYNKNLPINKVRVKAIDAEGNPKIFMDPNSPRKELSDTLKDLRTRSDSHRQVANMTRVDPLAEKMDKNLRDINQKYTPEKSKNINSTQIAKDFHNKQADDFRIAAKLVHNDVSLIDPRRAAITKDNSGKYIKHFNQSDSSYLKKYDQNGQRLDNIIGLRDISLNPNFNTIKLKKSPKY